MGIIFLTHGMITIVDDIDYERLNKFKWHAHRPGGSKSYYARRAVYVDGKQRLIYMHREILNTPIGDDSDHINHDTLNNLRSNLRNCTRTENCRNRSAIGVSKYHGVTITKHKYIQSYIQTDGKRKYLGSFKTEEAAALAYDEAAKIYFGEFANLNFK